MNCSVEGSYHNVSFWLTCWWQTLTCFFESISGLWFKGPSTLWTGKGSRIIHAMVLSLQMRKSEAQRGEFICPSLPTWVKSDLGLEDSSDFLVWGSVSCVPCPLREHDPPHSKTLFSSPCLLQQVRSCHTFTLSTGYSAHSVTVGEYLWGCTTQSPQDWAPAEVVCSLMHLELALFYSLPHNLPSASWDHQINYLYSMADLVISFWGTQSKILTNRMNA